MLGWNINSRFVSETLKTFSLLTLIFLLMLFFEVDKQNGKPQNFMCSECKSIFRDVGCLNDLQTGEAKPLSSPVREVPPECSPQHGVP